MANADLALEPVEILLTAQQKAALEALSAQTGRDVSALVRERLDDLPAVPGEVADWKASILAGAGVWKDRDDIEPLMADMRRQLRERLDRLTDRE